MMSAGTSSIRRQQWIVSAAGGGRIDEVKHSSRVVLDGGPRWVLSTAFGFITGGLWWTVVYAAVFALANYTMYVNAKDASWTSGAELTGVVVCAMLIAAFSVTSIPGAWSVSDWKDLIPGLLVEVVLCVCVSVFVAITFNIFSPIVQDIPRWWMHAHTGRWFAPVLLWMAASKIREEAARAVEMKLASFWCWHPIGQEDITFSQVAIHGLWNEWSDAVQECARRVGGYSMLGFSAGDLRVLAAASPTPNAVETIQHLRLYVRRTAPSALGKA